MLNRFTHVPEISKDNISFIKSCMPNDVHIVTFMAPQNDSIASIVLGNFFQSLQKLPNEKVIAIVFGIKKYYNADHIMGLPFSNCTSVLYCNDTSAYAQQEAAQLIMGARKNSPPYTISSGIKYILGVQQIEQKEIETNGRLRYANASSVGLNEEIFTNIDSIALNESQKELSGCQVLVAIKGKIVCQKLWSTPMHQTLMR